MEWLYFEDLGIIWRLLQRIPQWPTKALRGNFEAVTRLRNDSSVAAQSGRTKKVAVYIAGFSEQLIFEMVMLQIADRIRHTLFTGQEGSFPKSFAVALDAYPARNLRRRRSDDDFWPE